jgi:hypothetical protein
MPFMPSDSIIAKSRQGWKLAVGITIGYAGGAALLWSLRREIAALAPIGIALALGSFAGMALAIRCCNCGARWLWIAVSTQHHLRWWHWLNAQMVCPKCSHDPGEHSKPAVRDITHQTPDGQ